MDLSKRSRRGLLGFAAVVTVLAMLIAIAGGVLQSGLGRPLLIALVERESGRVIDVTGPLRIAVFSAHPTFVAERVTIGNPPWFAAGEAARIGRLSLNFTWAALLHGRGFDALELDAAALHLERDASGRANWQWTDPDQGGHQDFPILRNLSMRDARVALRDARRHLAFDGTVSAMHVPRSVGGMSSFEIMGRGSLNGRHADFSIVADGLDAARHTQPYRFDLTARSSGVTLEAHGALPHPFDFQAIDASFAATGPDLKDLYWLTGVTLINTGTFTVSGRMTLRGAHTTFEGLEGRSGASDLAGRIGIDSTGSRPSFDADLAAQRIRLADLGERAAGRQSPDDDPPKLLLSQAAFNPDTLRKMDGKIRLRAQHVDVGRLTLSSFAATASLTRSVLIVPAATATLWGGEAVASLRIDAGTARPADRLDLRLESLQAQALARVADDPPLRGVWSAHTELTGQGSSLHEAASNASGNVTALLPGGRIRASLAELSGLDLRGLGLVLRGDRQESQVHCAVADFAVANGVLTARRLVFDTDQVLIHGQGTIDMHTETLDLQVRGQPKHARLLRLRAPWAVYGTLLHPAVSIAGGHKSLALFDAGLAGDVQCQRK